MTRLETIALSLIVLLILAASVMQLDAAFAGDKSWLLLAAKMWLTGGRLYVDVVEVNPPLIVWLYGLPVWLSLYVPAVSDYNALGAMGLAASALSVWLSVKLILLHPEFAGDKRRQAEFTLLLACLFVLFTSPVYFFDREHILLVLTFPYMLRFMPSLAHREIDSRLRAAIALMAAIGYCIKPYTVIVFAVLQLLYLLRERRAAILWSLENLIIYAFALFYLFCIWQFTPDYITTVLPMALETYSAFSRRLFGLFYAILALITAGITFADFRLRRQTPYRADILYFIGVSAAFFAYAMVNNGWGYTYHPLICMLLFLTGWVLWEHRWQVRQGQLPGKQLRQSVFGQRACAINLLLNVGYAVYFLFGFFTTPLCEWSADCVKNQPYLQYLREHHVTSFGALSEDFHKWASLARLSGARLDTRYNALWMVPGLAAGGEEFTQKHQWIVKNVGEGLADDLDRKKPQIVFVDDSRNFFGTSLTLSLPDFFLSVPQFKAAWSHYSLSDTIDRCKPDKPGDARLFSGCRYDIYGRTQ